MALASFKTASRDQILTKKGKPSEEMEEPPGRATITEILHQPGNDGRDGTKGTAE